jgi:hypothetical protein
MHGLMLATLPPGVTSRPLTERDAGGRLVEALAPPGPRTTAIDGLLDKLTTAAHPYSLA